MLHERDHDPDDVAPFPPTPPIGSGPQTQDDAAVWEELAAMAGAPSSVEMPLPDLGPRPLRRERSEAWQRFAAAALCWVSASADNATRAHQAANGADALYEEMIARDERDRAAREVGK